LLQAYCAGRGISHRRCGKLIVATSDTEAAALRRLQAAAAANGVTDLRWLSAQDVAELEPLLRCVAALESPSTGIVDVHELMAALGADVEASGGQLVLRTRFERAAPIVGGFALRLSDPGAVQLSCRELVNAAGLEASAAAGQIVGAGTLAVPRTRFARGHYFALGGAEPFRRLVYPIPEGGGLGIHATLDTAGRVRFGPDVEWIDLVDYEFGSDRVEAFAASIRRYYPALDQARLTPDYTGIRPKIYGPGDPPSDFRIDGPERHGVAGLVNLFGIESPGLTACLAIGEEVAGRLERIATR
jgi:L-2-hydroxyglutarate oxidase LhgO